MPSVQPLVLSFSSREKGRRCKVAPLAFRWGKSRGEGPSRSGLAAFFIALFLAAILGAIAASAQPTFPPLTGRIVDNAGLLTPADRAELENELRALEAKSSDQVVVYTTNSLQGYPIEDYGYQLGRAWGIGQKGTNNGVILIVAPNERKVRIEVGRGLVPAALKAVDRGGTVVCAGIHMSDIPTFPYETLWGERMVRSVANLTREDGNAFLRLAPQVGVRTEVQPYPLLGANEALADLRAGRVRGAAVLVPGAA